MPAAFTPFDFLNAINDTKVELIVDDISEKAYNSFMVNRGLSQFPDTVLYANEMNRHPHLCSKAKFSFLIHTVRKRKRFSKWAKAQAESQDIEIIKRYYGYSSAKARSVLTILTPEHIEQLKKRLHHGGTNDSDL